MKVTSPFRCYTGRLGRAERALSEMVDSAQTRSLLDGKDHLVQPSTGLPPAETGTRYGQLAGQTVGRE